MPVNGWMDKKDVVYMHNEISFSHEKGGYPFAICDTMDRPWTHYAKWDMSDRERQILYDIPYMWNPKSQTHKKQQNGVYRGWGHEGDKTDVV